MKYKLLGHQMHDLKQTVLFNRNIHNLGTLLNPPIDVLEDEMLYTLMDIAVDRYLEYIKNKESRIGIVVDPDVDGYTSGAEIYNYTTAIGHNKANIIYFLHEGKEHGLNSKMMEAIKEAKLDLLIIPDASANEWEKHNELINGNFVKDILVLDHHDVEGGTHIYSNAIIVNNQISQNIKNKNLSGVGVVHKFCCAVDKKLGTNLAEEYIDLVAVGNIGDMMELRELETRKFCLDGLKAFSNPLLVAFKESKITSLETNFIDIGFNLCPYINAVIRQGKMEEKDMMFRAFIEEEEMVEYKSKGEIKSQPLAEAVVRVSTNVKKRQDDAVKKAMGTLVGRIEERGLLNNAVLIINATGIISRDLNGLVANKLANEYKRPTLILQQFDEASFSGSARNYSKSEIKDLKSVLLSTECFNWCQGHGDSFGFSVTAQGIVQANEILNQMFGSIEHDAIYEVDGVLKPNEIGEHLLKPIADLNMLWGGSIPEPMFAITGIKISSKAIEKVGFATAKFNYGKTRFVKNYASKVFFEQIKCEHENTFGANNLEIDIVGKFKKDKYGLYVDIVDFNSKISTEIVF